MVISGQGKRTIRKEREKRPRQREKRKKVLTDLSLSFFLCVRLVVCLELLSLKKKSQFLACFRLALRLLEIGIFLANKLFRFFTAFDAE